MHFDREVSYGLVEKEWVSLVEKEWVTGRKMRRSAYLHWAPQGGFYSRKWINLGRLVAWQTVKTM